MFSISEAYVILFLAFLWSCNHGVAATASTTNSSGTALDAFHRSELFRNLSADSEKNLIQHLRQISQAPVKTRLKEVHELKYGKSRQALKEIMQRFPILGRGVLPRWFDDVFNFLNKFSQGEWAVEHGPATVTLNLTALTGLPMIRRSLLAQLAAAWLTVLEMDFPDALVPKLEQLVRKLYGIHVDSVAQRAVMEYFHISKAGGTSWNSAAKLNGCLRSMNIGSHVRGFGDECRWLNQTVYTGITGRRILWGRWGHVQRATRYRTCADRYNLVAARGFSFTSNEYTLVGGEQHIRQAHVCPHLVNVVTLRNPLKRMESNIRFVMMHIKAAYRRHIAGGEEAFNKVFCNASGRFWQALGPPITDNYIVRSFLGEVGFHTPVGDIGRVHVAAARDQLLQFDLVLDLDAGEEANDRIAQQGLGWPAALSRAHALDSSVLSIRMDLNYTECHPDDAGMEELKKLQAPDTRLYGVGRVVSQLDALWLDMARALGLRPLAKEPRPDADPAEINCGLLWRSSNQSALTQALYAAGFSIVPVKDAASVASEAQQADAAAGEEGHQEQPADKQQPEQRPLQQSEQHHVLEQEEELEKLDLEEEEEETDELIEEEEPAEELRSMDSDGELAEEEEEEPQLPEGLKLEAVFQQQQRRPAATNVGQDDAVVDFEYVGEPDADEDVGDESEEVDQDVGDQL